MGSTGQAKKKALKCNDTSSSHFACAKLPDKHLKFECSVLHSNVDFMLNLTNIQNSLLFEMVLRPHPHEARAFPFLSFFDEGLPSIAFVYGAGREGRNSVLLGRHFGQLTHGFGKVMSRNRFEIILSFLHFTNNSEFVGRGQPGHDRLFKVHPVIDLIIPHFSAVYGPLKELSLDEITIAFKGKSTLKT